MHTSSSYAKILGETNFQPWEFSRSRSLAKDRGEKTPENPNNLFLYISSIYAKILEETNVQPREFPRSGSKAKDVKEERGEMRRDQKLVITMASYALQMPPRVAHASCLGQNLVF